MAALDATLSEALTADEVTTLKRQLQKITAAATAVISGAASESATR